METFVKKTEPVTGSRTIVSALFVEQGAIYCACKVVMESSHFIFTLHKFKHDGTFIFYMKGFNHIRGIVKDSNGNYYVSDSLAWNRVLKFDNNWNPLRKTHHLASETVDAPYGIYLDEDVGEDALKEQNKNIYCIILLQTSQSRSSHLFSTVESARDTAHCHMHTPHAPRPHLLIFGGC